MWNQCPPSVECALKDALRLKFEGQQSHQQIATVLGITAGKDSLAGKLLQGKKPGLVFVGASLLANGGGQRASPEAKIRRQASAHRGRGGSLPL
jgi:hypothetical protein